MIDSKYIPAARQRIEVRFVNSRFIGDVAPTATVDEAKAFIAEIRAAMPDANHHVYAYIIGHGATTTLGLSDDGEPPGTAGRPVMAVLKGSGLGDATVVVTRYFGGTLLGTGGLVRAYGDTAKEVLAAVPRTEKIDRRQLLVVLPYAVYEQAKRLLTAHAGDVLTEDFAADVTLAVQLPIHEADAFVAAIETLTAGQAQIERLDDGP